MNGKSISILTNWLFPEGADEKTIERRAYIWNLIASLVFSVQSALLLLAVTRFVSLAAAGRFFIYYVTTQMLASLGGYSMRNFQVSDTRQEYPLNTYFSSRVITCAGMFLATILYAVVTKRTAEGVAVLLLLAGYRAVEAIEDITHAQIQKEGRLDAVSVAKTIRIGVATVVFMLVCAVTKNMILSSAALLASAMVIYLICQRILQERYRTLRFSFLPEKVGKLLVACFPVAAGAVLYSYLANAPKYAIERALSEDMQAIYNILFMPIFLVSVLGQFVFVPMVARMSVWWKEGEKKTLRAAILRQVVIILAIAVAVALAGYVLGYWLLGIVYGVDLRPWRGLLVLLLLIGGISALCAFFTVILTIMRRQIVILIAYVIAAVTGRLILDPIVARYALQGAGLGYGILMLLVLAVFVVATVVEFRRKRPGGTREEEAETVSKRA